jgi:Protein of unknown function (DUF4235)
MSTQTQSSSSSGPSRAHSVAPLAAVAATWGARKAITKGYEKGTGKPAPIASSPENSILTKVLWAAALAATIAVAESLVWKALGDRRAHHNDAGTTEAGEVDAPEAGDVALEPS